MPRQASPDDIQKALTSILDVFEESSGLKITRLLRVEFWQGSLTTHLQLERDEKARISLLRKIDDRIILGVFD
jgi:hypothetical protein